MLSEYYYNFFNMTIVLETNDSPFTDLINAILGDIRCEYKNDIIATITQEFDGDYYVFKANNEIFLKCKDLQRAALEISSEIINRFVHNSNGLLYLHAGAVQKNDKVIIVVGGSRSGKTSLVSVLINRYGYKFLSDEIVPIVLSNGNVVPFHRALSIRKETLPFLKISDSLHNDVSTVDGEAVKFVSYKILSNATDVDINNKISTIAFPHFGEDTLINEVDVKSALTKLLESSVNFRCVVNEGLDFIVKMLPSVKLYELTIKDVGDAAKCVSKLFE